MTLDEFADTSGRRILTPAEFVAFVRGMGWRIDTDGTAARLRGVKAGADRELAEATARMLARDPYRTNVLAELRAEWKREEDSPKPTQAVREVPDLLTCPLAEVVRACRAFRFTPAVRDGKLIPLPDDGVTAAEVKASIPAWLSAGLLARKAELLAFLAPPEPDVMTAEETDFCRRCKAMVNAAMRADAVTLCRMERAECGLEPPNAIRRPLGYTPIKPGA